MNEAAERLLAELQENPLPGARHAYSIVRDRLPAILAHERSAGAAPLDVERLPSGARLSLQKGDDYGNGPWYAVVENTIDLPDRDTACIGSGSTPQQAMGAAISRYVRPTEGTDR